MKLTHKLPRKYWIAVSGGIDSMAALHWLNKRSRRSSLLGLLHVNHNTGEFANEAEKFVRQFGLDNDIPVDVLSIKDNPPKGVSKEAWWRDKRYEFFKSFEAPIILGHNFDDCLEEYIMCTMVRGYSSTIAYSNENCVRPFRLWKRKDISKYMRDNSFSHIEDPSNKETNFKRNYIRHEIVPKIKELNPGVYNIVRRLIENAEQNTKSKS